MSEKEEVDFFLQSGAAIIGQMAGITVGQMAGMNDSLSGSVAGIFISKGILELAKRIFSKREKARLGAAASIIIYGIEERRKRGDRVREDDFFTLNDSNRAKATELFEGILLKCRDEYQEKKILYISRLYENVVFSSFISSDDANQILNGSQQLSYRQLLIIALIGQNVNNKFALKNRDYYTDDQGKDVPLADLPHNQQFILQDFVTIYTQGLMEREDGTAIMQLGDVAVGKMRLTLIGKSYYDFLSLSHVPTEEFHFLQALKE